MVKAVMLSALLATSAATAGAIKAPRAAGRFGVGNPAMIPGVDTLSSGFNAVTGEANLMSIFVPDSGSTTVFDMPDSNGVQYSVPSNVKAATVDMTQVKSNQCLSMDFENYLHTYVSSFGISLSVGAACFKATASYNKEVGHVKNMTSNSMNAVDMGIFEVVPYKLEALPYFVRPQDTAFTMTIAAMPKTITSDSDKQIVAAFIQAFGTHFVQEVTCGLRLNHDSFVNSETFDSYNHDWTSEQMSLTLHYDIYDLSTGGFKNRSDINISDVFKKNSASTITYIGGDQALQTNSTLKEWKASVDHFPVPLNYTITELSTAVKDSGVKAMLKKVYDTYLNTGDLPGAIDAVAEEHTALQRESFQPFAPSPATFEEFKIVLDPFVLDNRRRAKPMAAKKTEKLAKKTVSLA